MRACASGLSLANGISTPIRRICSDCCARAASGQATAEPPTSVMKSRRLMERLLRTDDCSLSHCPAPARQPHRELGEVADFAIDHDGAAVLLRYDLVADRQPKAGTLAGRLGREERLEQLLPVLQRNANAIVAHPDLDLF